MLAECAGSGLLLGRSVYFCQDSGFERLVHHSLGGEGGGGQAAYSSRQHISIFHGYTDCPGPQSKEYKQHQTTWWHHVGDGCYCEYQSNPPPLSVFVLYHIIFWLHCGSDSLMTTTTTRATSELPSTRLAIPTATVPVAVATAIASRTGAISLASSYHSNHWPNGLTANFFRQFWSQFLLGLRHDLPLSIASAALLQTGAATMATSACFGQDSGRGQAKLCTLSYSTNSCEPYVVGQDTNKNHDC